MKFHRPVPKLKLSGSTLRRRRRLSRPQKACYVIRSAWISLAQSFRYARSSLLGPGPAWFPRESSLASAEVPLWGMHNEQGRLIMAYQRVLTKLSLFLAPQSFTTTFYVCLDLQECFIQETDVFQTKTSLDTGSEAKIVWLQTLDLPLSACGYWAGLLDMFSMAYLSMMAYTTEWLANYVKYQPITIPFGFYDEFSNTIQGEGSFS